MDDHGHDHGHEHDHAPHLSVIHVTAPGCHWSWGYEAVFQRLRLVYGDQLDHRILVNCPYESFDEWLTQYEMSWDEAMEWFQGEVAPLVGVPIKTGYTKDTIPPNVLPGSLALVAAGGQGEEAFERYNRVLTRRIVVEGQDPGKEEVLLDAAKEAQLDITAFKAALKDVSGVREAYDNQDTTGLPHLPLGFYNLAVYDGHGRSVLIDHAFDPRVVEEAVDYLSGGKLKKIAPKDLVTWARDFGPTSALEVSRVFAIPQKDAQLKLENAEKSGELERVSLAGAAHWRKPR